MANVISKFCFPDLDREGEPAITRGTQALDLAGRAACEIQYLRGIRGARFPVFPRDQPSRLAGGAVEHGDIPSMQRMFALAFLATNFAFPAMAQISDAAAKPDMQPFFAKANLCLKTADTKAKAKKVSVETYKAVIDGACTTEINDLRGLYSLSLEGSDSQRYLLDRFDEDVRNARAKMVSDYAIR